MKLDAKALRYMSQEDFRVLTAVSTRKLTAIFLDRITYLLHTHIIGRNGFQKP